MRIGIFSESYEPVQNGVSVSVRTLVDELRSQKHNVFIVAPHYPDHNDEIPFVLRVPSLITPFNADYPLSYPWYPRMLREAGRIAPDVIHSHNPFFLGILASRLARIDHVPLVSTYHTLYSHYAHYVFFLPDPAIQSLLEWWLPEYYNRCARVIVPSRVAEESLRDFGVQTPIVTVPTGVPLPPSNSMDETARQAVRAQWHIPPCAPLLLYVGRLAKEKNLELVIEAFERISNEFDDAHLLIVGGGPHLEACRKFAGEMTAGARIVFTGPIPREELDPVYAAADLFVFGSATETQGLVVAEARAAGTPCVVVNAGGAAETVRNGEDGLIVPPALEPFANAIRILLCDNIWRASLRAACLRNARHFTPGAMTAQVVEVYEQVIEEARSRHPVVTGRS